MSKNNCVQGTEEYTSGIETEAPLIDDMVVPYLVGIDCVASNNEGGRSYSCGGTLDDSRFPGKELG